MDAGDFRRRALGGACFAHGGADEAFELCRVDCDAALTTSWACWTAGLTLRMRLSANSDRYTLERSLSAWLYDLQQAGAQAEGVMERRDPEGFV